MRPLGPYPQYAQYAGTEDIHSAANPQEREKRLMRNKRVNHRKAIQTDRNRSHYQVIQGIAISFSTVVLLLFAGCAGNLTPLAPPISAIPTDYSRARNWETLPNASQAVDVLFFYPTTYRAPGTLGSTWTSTWNQTIAEAYDDPKIKSQITSKTGVFAEAGTNLYVPYYQQVSGVDLLDALLYSTTPQNATAANDALQVAYKDVSNAFEYYLAHFNKDAAGNRRPFILAGHSQGSNLLLMLLKDKFSDPALRKQLVAAYVIGWSVTADDMNNYPGSLAKIGICGIPSTRLTGCIITYNTQDYPGPWSGPGAGAGMGLVQPNAYSVNPLTWVASGPGEVEATAGPALANLGALFYPGLLGNAPTVTFNLDPDTGNYTYEIDHYTGAQNENGALVINNPSLPPANQGNLVTPYDVAPFFHNYDYTFFYRNLEKNVVSRINAYNAQ
jgi:hypothetical protein